MNHTKAAKAAPPPPPSQPVRLGSNYGYGGGGGYSQAPVPVSPGYGYGGSAAPPPPPPPPPPDDIPLPPEYSYPRFLEPNIAANRVSAEDTHGWRRKTDADCTPAEPKKDISATQKALITAAERAAKITGKLTGTKPKPAFDETNVPGTC